MYNDGINDFDFLKHLLYIAVQIRIRPQLLRLSNNQTQTTNFRLAIH